jgi:hypothetical protein
MPSKLTGLTAQSRAGFATAAVSSGIYATRDIIRLTRAERMNGALGVLNNDYAIARQKAKASVNTIHQIQNRKSVKEVIISLKSQSRVL